MKQEVNENKEKNMEELKLKKAETLKPKVDRAKEIEAKKEIMAKLTEKMQEQFKATYKRRDTIQVKKEKAL